MANKKSSYFKKRILSKVNQKTNDNLIEYAKMSNSEVFKKLNTSVHGLTTDKYEELKKIDAKNIIVTKKRRWYHYVVDSFLNPFSIILMLIAGLNLLTLWLDPESGSDAWVSFGIIFTMLFISGFVKLFQDMRSNIASQKLKDMVKTTTLVERNDIKSEIIIDNIVTGDIVHLAAGDIVPADMLILQSKDLFVTQSVLTGESEPIEKMCGANIKIDENEKNAFNYQNLCFMGTTVSSGSAMGVVLNVGQNTLFGKIAYFLNKKRPKTNFDKGLRNVSFMLIVAILIMVTIIFFLQALTKNNSSTTGIDKSINNHWIQSLSFSLALVIGLTPEMLPMIVSVNLSKEAFRLSKQKTIVKNINSIQSFGAMNVLCTDKTGTLTEDKIIMERYVDINNKPSDKVLSFCYLNSFFQTGLKNLLDLSIIQKAKDTKIDSLINQYIKIDEIPFDFNRRRMSVLVKHKQNNRISLITKGAIEEMLSVCDYVEINNKSIKITNAISKQIKELSNSLNANGMRVIAIATNKKQININSVSVKDENELILLGLSAFFDPPKATAKKAIMGLKNKGINVKVLTGDNEIITKYICSQVGINFKKILLGDDIDKLSFDDLKIQVSRHNVFAKLSPEQKAKIIYAIKSNKNVVGYMGDGINDAPAMRAADIAISVDTAVDIAKECADIILLEKDLTILNSGVVEGRKTYANIIKYIKITVSSSFGNMLSMLFASIWLPFQPMLATQILILNLIYDFSQFAMPWDNVDNDFISKPRNWSARSILKFMVFMGPVSSLFDIASFLIMFSLLGWNDPNNPKDVLSFQTGWFLLSLLTQTLVIIVLRSKHFPFMKTFPSMFLSLSLMILVIVGVMAVTIPGLNPIFNSLPTIKNGAIFIGCCFGLAFIYAIGAQIAKTGYVKIFKQWL